MTETRIALIVVLAFVMGFGSGMLALVVAVLGSKDDR